MIYAAARHRRAPAPRQPLVPLVRGSLTHVNALAVCSAVTALFWPEPVTQSVADLAAVRFPSELGPASGPVELVAVQAPVVWSDVQVPLVRTTLRNVGEEPVRARAWWLLGTPNDPKPWETPRGHGAPVDVTLAPGETSEVELPVSDLPQAGTWRLSVWVHTVERDRMSRSSDETSTHSHGSGTAPYVTVLSTDEGVLRLSPPGREAALTGLEVGEPLEAGANGEAEGDHAVVSVRSASAQPVYVEVQCYLAPPGTNEPWLAPEAVLSETVTATVEPNPHTVPCVFPELPAGGSWQLSAFARLPGRDDERSHQDGLYVQQAIELGEPSEGEVPAAPHEEETSEPVSPTTPPPSFGAPR